MGDALIASALDTDSHGRHRVQPWYIHLVSSTRGGASSMPGQDQIIDAVMARSIQADVARAHPLLAAWIVMRDEEEYPGQIVARLVTDALTPYVLLADTLGQLHAHLPPGLVRSDRQPSDPPEVVEIWFLPSG
jgi:hypothetical protein